MMTTYDGGEYATEGWLSMGSLRPWHVIVIVVLAVLLFGAKRLPDAARSLGRSMRILKAEAQGLKDDDVKAKAAAKSGFEPMDRQLDNEPSRIPVVDPIERVRDN
jgi:sec-independent protein translocase protein TatA